MIRHDVPVQVLRLLVAPEVRHDPAGAVLRQDLGRDLVDNSSDLCTLGRLRLEQRRYVALRDHDDVSRK